MGVTTSRIWFYYSRSTRQQTYQWRSGLYQSCNILENKPPPDMESFAVDVITPKYSASIWYLTFQTFSNSYSEKSKSRLILKSVLYTMIDDGLYKQRGDGISRRCIFQSKVCTTFWEDIIWIVMENIWQWPSPAHKALMAGYRWPTLFSDTHQHVRSHDPCQWIARPIKTSAMSWISILA